MSAKQGRRRIIAAGWIAVIPAIAAAASPWAFSDGPPAGRTGGFGEPLCTECHFDNPANDSAGAMEISGLPERFAAGQAYAISIRLRHPDMQRGGFQLAARWMDGPSAGRQAGRLEPVDEHVKVRDSNEVRYAQHGYARDRAKDTDAVTWTVRWIAPEKGSANVAVDVAANAANGDFSSLGDYIYSRRVIVQP